MNDKKFKTLTKEEMNTLSPDEKHAYRAWKRSENEKRERAIFAKEKLQEQFHSKQEYLDVFQTIDLPDEEWENILTRYYGKIYSFRKIFGILGKAQCEQPDFYEHFQTKGGFFLPLFEAIFSYFNYKSHEDILERMLIEGLKFPIKEVRLFCDDFLNFQIMNDNIRLLFWRELLEKRYVSGATWKTLVNFYPQAVEKGIVEDIYHAIKTFVDNPDKDKRNIDQMEENWRELKINPLETYKF